MGKSAIKNIIIIHYRHLNKFIKKVNKHFEPESIHQLRVEFKKLRAFLRMISAENEGRKKIKLAGRLKRGYRIAGEIRNLQLHHQRMLAIKEEETKPAEVYLKILEQNINKLKPKFSDIPLKKTIKKSIKKAEELNGKKINTRCAAKFIEKNCATIIAIIASGNFADVNMHAIRKYLKDIFYTIHVLENAKEEIKFSNTSITNDEMKYFDGLLEELGNFQDRVTSLALLNEQCLNLLSADDRQLMTGIKEMLTADKYAMKDNLVIKLQNELIPHLQIFQISVVNK